MIDMDRLVPFEKLQDDYYVGDTIRDGLGHGESDADDSSDDEVQRTLKKIAGYGPDVDSEGAKLDGKSEFEEEMNAELDDKMGYHVRETMKGADDIDIGDKKMIDTNTPKVEEIAMDEDMPPLEDIPEETKEDTKAMESSSSSPKKSSLRMNIKRKEEEGEDIEMKDDDEEGYEEKKKVKFCDVEDKKKEDESDEDDESSDSDDDIEDSNPIRKSARESKKSSKASAPDFYNPTEDDDNEQWVQERRHSSQGRPAPQRKVNPKQTRLEDGSDAVLSCPGCMVLLTRDCQRHEIYKDQYRAMFVENCRVDREEKLTIEKTGKDKRRERNRIKKMEASGSSLPFPQLNNDIFVPVRCAVCSTKVAVMDQDEVYHFFNVLSGYS